MCDFSALGLPERLASDLSPAFHSRPKTRALRRAFRSCVHPAAVTPSFGIDVQVVQRVAVALAAMVPGLVAPSGASCGLLVSFVRPERSGHGFVLQLRSEVISLIAMPSARRGRSFRRVLFLPQGVTRTGRCNLSLVEIMAPSKLAEIDGVVLH